MKKLYIIIMCMCIPVMYAQDLEETFTGPKQEEAMAPAPAARSYGSAGSVHSQQGDIVWYFIDAPQVKKGLREYSPVSSEAIIETGVGSWVIIALRDKGGYVYLGSNTKAKIVYETYKQRSHWVRVELLRGTVRACCTKLSKLYSCFAVVTPNASVGTSEGGDILVQYSGAEDGTGGVTVAESLKGEMGVTHMSIKAKALQRKPVNEGEAVKIYTGRRIVGPSAVSGLEGKQTFWTEHNVSFKAKEKVSRHKVRINREIERLKSGEPRLTPHTLAR